MANNNCGGLNDVDVSGAEAAGSKHIELSIGEDDTVGNPHRAQIYKFALVELVLLLKLDEQFSSLSSNSRQQYLSQQDPPPLLIMAHV